MEYFKKYFPEANFDGDEIKIKCPFHDDRKPSASINKEKKLFHCFTCDIGLTEDQFIAKINNIPLKEAVKYKEKASMSTMLNWELYSASLWSNNEVIEELIKFGIDREVIDKARLGLLIENKLKYIAIPVFFNDVIMDIRIWNFYKHEDKPKVRSLKGSEVGFVVPYDVWIKTDEPVYLFEGEKDMLIARSQGLNAITLTGGAGALVNDYMLNSFADKTVILCYDNDETGQKGMKELFHQLETVTKKVSYVDIGELVKNEKEDFSDFIQLYNGDIFDFVALPEKTYEKEEIQLQDQESLITIVEALNSKEISKLIVSEVTITSEFSDNYIIPTLAKMEKMQSDKSSTMVEGETRVWELNMEYPIQMLELMEVDAKKQLINSKLKRFAGIPDKEKDIRVSIVDSIPVYKATAIDKEADGSSLMIELYSFERLIVGNQYQINYRLMPHPTKQQKIVAIVSRSRALNELAFCIPDKTLLSYFQGEDIIDNLLNQFESMKHYVEKHLDFKLWLMMDLVFNSLLDINYEKDMRGALDVFILGDTQVGKSTTAKLMTELYNFGHFLSLKTSTTIGLIGGSTKVDGCNCNTIGAIPRQHKRLVILEEFSGAKSDFISTMTDLRSSNELRLVRAAGELIVPCKLRMITISNPVNDNQGNSKDLSTFTNGVIPIMELIRNAEDVARYDAFMLVPRKELRINPFKTTLSDKVIPREAYLHHIKWSTSRKAEDVEYVEDVENYIWDKAKELNELFECNFTVFGVTTPKKLARFAVALAALTVSTNSTYEKVVVTKDIVNYVVDFLKGLYDNDIFRLKEYKTEYDAYSKLLQSDIDTLESLYANNSVLLGYIYEHNKMSRAGLRTVSGFDNDRFNIVFSKLIQCKFIRLDIDTVYTTEKYRKAYSRVNRTFTIDSGEMLINE